MSSIVSNPYSFNIGENTAFSASVTVALPDKETSLLFSTGNETKTITIPTGVNVIKIILTSYADGDQCNLTVTNASNRKYWASLVSREYGDTSTTYIGVTPNKAYRIFIDQVGYADGDCEILYSAFINQQAPTVTDC